MAQMWRVKYEDIKWPKNKGKFGSKKSMVCHHLFRLTIFSMRSCTDDTHSLNGYSIAIDYKFKVL